MDTSSLLSGTTLSIIGSTLVACAVEMVEVSTIVVGIGSVRGWKSTLIGSGAGLLLLTLIVIGLGSQISHLPIHWLRLIVGTLLLTFGLNWLRKAILKYAKNKKGGEEEEDYQGNTGSKFGVSDWYAFTVAFKGTLLEGLEIAFIILTFGASSGNLTPALLGGGTAVVVIGVAAVFVKSQIAKIPERMLKFIVGILLATFGTFWTAKGAYVAWPSGDAALIPLVTLYLLAALGSVWLGKRLHNTVTSSE